jgi:hypothetical protein
MWLLFDESRSGIFYELKLIDITLLYGQVSYNNFLNLSIKIKKVTMNDIQLNTFSILKVLWLIMTLFKYIFWTCYYY